MGYIYIVINDINHKVYIGQTSTSLKQGKYTGKDNGFYGKHHTQETKDIISKCNTGRKSNRRKPIKLVELNNQFNSYTEAWKWLVAQGLCKTKAPQSCTTQIKDSIKRNTKAYGYHWEEV